MSRFLYRSSLFTRFALANAAGALIATLMLYAASLFIVMRASDAELARAVDTEIAALADVYATGGEAELNARVADRLAMLPPGGGDRVHYMVADATGRRIAGDIAHWPLLSAENSQSGFVDLAGGPAAFARATQLAPGLRIVAAREYGDRLALIAMLGWAFLVAGALILLGALGFAWFAANRLRARVDATNAAFRAIEDGRLDHRVPGADRRDEFGELAGHANLLVGRLATLIEAQRDVTDQVAHEIRTPLMHLDTRLLKLVDRTVDPVAVATIGEARAEARGIAQLLDSLLDIAASRARRGDRSGFQRIDLSELAADTAELFADSAEDQGLVLDTQIAPGVTLQGNAMQLTRLLSNLIDNAFKYVGPAGHIALIVEPGPRIIVRDNGPGVPEAMRAQIFERFQRVGDQPAKGHGLGLALARAIAERHDLTIRCEDAAPGAAFIIEAETM